MSTPTQQRSGKQRAREGKVASSTKTARVSAVTNRANRARAKQTARIEGLRDGKPLIFGWGKHLTRAQKARYQHRAMWSFIAVVCVAVVGTIVFGVLNELIFVPNATIVSVNGTNISQDTYRKELAYQAQVVWNRVQSEIAAKNAIAAKVQAGDPTATQQDTILTTQLQSDEAAYAQAQITQTTITALTDDLLIQAGARNFEQQNHAPASAFTPTQKQINDALASFKKAFPSGETYAQFLSADGLSNSDVVNSITRQLRRGDMQTYLASQFKSPTRQVHLRRIEVDTAATAAKVRAQLIAGKLTNATWLSLAKKYSLDTGSKDTGGDQGWVPYGAGDGGIEYWAYNPSRKVGDLSPVIFDASGTYDVVQVIGIDPSRAVAATTLSTNKSNALAHWLSLERVIPVTHITSANSTMLNAPRNLPKVPSLSATLPAVTPTITTGLPGIGG